MLYITTRNADETYLVREALQADYAPDGGFFIPDDFPVLSDSMRYGLSAMSPCEAIATALNLLFGTELTAWSVECAVGRHPIRMESVGHNLQFAELWHNPKQSMDFMCRSLHSALSGRTGESPKGWTMVAIRIALLFGICAEGSFTPVNKFDLAVSADEAVDFVAALYAKDMGLPIGRILYAGSNDDDCVWQLMARGTCPAVPNGTQPWEDAICAAYLSCYLNGHADSGQCRLDADRMSQLQQTVYTAVISGHRAAQIINGVFYTNAYLLDHQAAQAYGALQDYRAITGNNRQTVILCMQKPNT